MTPTLASESVAVPVSLRTLAPDEKRTLVQRLFSGIAPRYDWFNRLASCGLDQHWRRTALRRAGVAPGQRVLDACTGTGDLALLCAGQLQGRGVVLGADMNRDMLMRANAKGAKAGRRLHPSTRADALAQDAAPRDAPAGLHWLQADAQALPFSAASFDRVLIGFSTRNLSDLAAGLREMVRVLKPGGRLVILETGYPSHPVLRAGYQLFLFTVARAIGFLLTGKAWPFTYLARPVRQFLTPAQMIACLQRVETRVEYIPISCGLASLYIATKP